MHKAHHPRTEVPDVLRADLFSWCDTLPYAKGRITSRAGAVHAAQYKKTQSARILDALREAGVNGATACELKKATGITQSSTMSARLNGLMHNGEIYDSGMTRDSEHGVENIVWKLTTKGE